jgi:hypothetical protein
MNAGDGRPHSHRDRGPLGLMHSRRPQPRVLHGGQSLQRRPSDADSPGMTGAPHRLISISNLLYSMYAITRLAQ